MCTKKITLICIILCVIGVILFTMFQNDYIYRIYWPKDRIIMLNNGFQTRILESAQKETSFTIVVPGYLPRDINPKPYIYGSRRSPPYNMMIELQYVLKENNEIAIFIEENDVNIDFLPSQTDSSRFDFHGVNILEQKTVIDLFGRKGTEEMVGRSFSWNKETMSFRMQIFNYARDEALKIIESMIK